MNDEHMFDPSFIGSDGIGELYTNFYYILNISTNKKQKHILTIFISKPNLACLYY